MTASVHVHGVPGRSLLEAGVRAYGAADARRGSFIEQAVGRALEHWLSRRPDCAGLHLFHDLGGFRDAAGHDRGRGILIRPDGTVRPQRWLDSRRERSAAGVLVWLTGLRGWPV